ncbi:hypothetical protein PoB_000225600 [Plakobranchus ocellatus]|uniref:Uncharacterized protein n=1 Tax=Plakobranchus ocellatus TaxID=259542 RepID=A0AAV3XY27_9GAST|nr:hypothetical protein PoB_000225600 [Plakobranchus ocellatus]
MLVSYRASGGRARRQVYPESCSSASGAYSFNPTMIKRANRTPCFSARDSSRQRGGEQGARDQEEGGKEKRRRERGKGDRDPQQGDLRLLGPRQARAPVAGLKPATYLRADPLSTLPRAPPLASDEGGFRSLK